MRNLSFGAVVLVVLVSAGCSITVGTGGGHERSRRTVERGADTATLTEIDAAADLTFDSGKEKAFIGIASRPELSAAAQVYLVKKAMGSLSFDDAKRKVLLALVNNPDFLAEGKQAVLDNLNALVFDSGKQQVLEAINRRGRVPSQREFYLERRYAPEPPKDDSVKIETTVDMRATYMTEL